jgi:uncharacterized protein (DUF779 family)
MCMAKEPYVYGKRALCVRQNSPMCMAKEPYVYGKRALCVWQKSPMCMAKEPYVYCKRALLATIMDDGEPPPCGPTAQDALCLAERDLLTI